MSKLNKHKAFTQNASIKQTNQYLNQDQKNSKKSSSSPSLSTKEKEFPTSETVLSSNPEDFVILKPSTAEKPIREVSIIQNK